MYSLQLYANQCITELKKLNVPIGIVDKFTPHANTKRWGQCKLTSNVNGVKHFEIQVNTALLNEKNGDAGLKNTLMHELLHTCKNSMKHTGEWKRWAEYVNRSLQINIKRCSSAEDKGVVEGYDRPKNYCIECRKCGYKVYRERMSDLVKYPALYHHKGCGGTFMRVK